MRPTGNISLRSLHSFRVNFPRWLRLVLAGNPFYLLSAALLLFGINRLSVDPEFLGEELHKLAFNFSALQIYEILEGLNRRRGLSVLVISHDLNLAARYCRRLHLIREGKLRASGSPPEVMTGDIIREVYGTDAEIGRDPRTGSPFVIPYPSSSPGGTA